MCIFLSKIGSTKYYISNEQIYVDLYKYTHVIVKLLTMNEIMSIIEQYYNPYSRGLEGASLTCVCACRYESLLYFAIFHLDIVD